VERGHAEEINELAKKMYICFIHGKFLMSIFERQITNAAFIYLHVTASSIQWATEG
jgi:hypothetical protein